MILIVTCNETKVKFGLRGKIYKKLIIFELRQT